jgi:hypothetical protein
LSGENFFDRSLDRDFAVFVERIWEALRHIVKVFDLHNHRVRSNIHFALFLKGRLEQRVKRAFPYQDVHGASWDGIIAHYAHFSRWARSQQVLRAMKGSVDLKADCTCLSFNNFTKRVSQDGSSLNVAQTDQVFVHENFSTLLLIVRLHSPKKSMSTLLYCGSQFVRQIDIDLVAHMLGKHRGEFF